MILIAKDNRFRSWAFVVYPDSAPENWEYIIDDRHIRWACSPLHDRDTNPTGEVKKPHWHVIVDFDGKKSFDQIKDISSSVKGTIPIALDSLVGYFRYFTHQDNPEKAQYCVGDIRCYGGFDSADLLRPTVSKQYKYISEMVDFIVDNNVTSYAWFVTYCKNNQYEKWFPLLCDKCSYFIERVINDIKNDSYYNDD